MTELSNTMVRNLAYVPILNDYTSDNNPVEVPKGKESEANIIASGRKEGLYHHPVLDLDFPCELIPSSTDGKYHLYMDIAVSWDKYVKVLEAMADANILEAGYVSASKSRGFTAVRAPWVRKFVPEKVLFNTETISNIPFPTKLSVVESSNSNRELVIVGCGNVNWQKSLAQTEFILNPEEHTLDKSNEVWVRVDKNKSPELEILEKEGFVDPVEGHTFSVSSKYYAEDIPYQKYRVRTMIRNGSKS